jgi:hypothetical protein
MGTPENLTLGSVDEVNTVAERLFSRVQTSPVPAACWPWTGLLDEDGYGKLRVAANVPKRFAHRVAWELAHGHAIPDGMLVCHRCDNPVCCRPSHLFLGTNLDNRQDAMRKGRISGKTNPWVREQMVARIFAGEITRAEAARQVGVSESAVCRWVKVRQRDGAGPVIDGRSSR